MQRPPRGTCRMHPSGGASRVASIAGACLVPLTMRRMPKLGMYLFTAQGFCARCGRWSRRGAGALFFDSLGRGPLPQTVAVDEASLDVDETHPCRRRPQGARCSVGHDGDGVMPGAAATVSGTGVTSLMGTAGGWELCRMIPIEQYTGTDASAASSITRCCTRKGWGVGKIKQIRRPIAGCSVPLIAERMLRAHHSGFRWV